MTSTQTIEELSAQCAAKYGITREMIDHAERWTETDGDLEGLSEERVRGILDMRFGAIAVDTPRSELWHTPDTIDVIEDIPYLPDGGYDTEAGQCRGHLLDLYLPHDAVLRCGHTLPVYIDIHGGGFTYGYKELNRNFNVHLAETGFAVFSLNYRPAPQTDLRGQLADVQAALRWIKAHLTDYPVNPNAVFLTGDSAGGDPLVTIILAKPCGAIVSNKLELLQDELSGDMVLITGTAVWGRLVNADGIWAGDGDVSLAAGDGAFKLAGDSLNLFAGGYVVLGTATLE